MKIEINCETGEVIEMPVTEQDILEGKTLTEPPLEVKQKNEAKTAAEAKLAALGLTTDDLKALGLN